MTGIYYYHRKRDIWEWLKQFEWLTPRPTWPVCGSGGEGGAERPLLLVEWHTQTAAIIENGISGSDLSNLSDARAFFGFLGHFQASWTDGRRKEGTNEGWNGKREGKGEKPAGKDPFGIDTGTRRLLGAEFKIPNLAWKKKCMKSNLSRWLRMTWKTFPNAYI